MRARQALVERLEGLGRLGGGRRGDLGRREGLASGRGLDEAVGAGQVGDAVVLVERDLQPAQLLKVF